jgi:hypothetical protein
VRPIKFAQMKVESPKKGAIRREAASSMPMLVMPPKKTIIFTSGAMPVPTADA